MRGNDFTHMALQLPAFDRRNKEEKYVSILHFRKGEFLRPYTQESEKVHEILKNQISNLQ